MRNGTTEIKVDGLLLRRFNEGDLKAFHYNWANNPNVTKYLSWPHHESLDVTKTVLDMFISSYKDGAYNWAIVPDSLGEPIGNISVVKDDFDLGFCEIGYCIGEEYWGKGYTSLALANVIKYLFTEGYDRIIAKHDLCNPISGKVMVKCSMSYFGECYAKSNRGNVKCACYRIDKK